MRIQRLFALQSKSHFLDFTIIYDKYILNYICFLFLGVLAVIFILLVLLAILAGRYVARHKGEYITQEDKGAEVALDPDSAVVRSRTGHQVNKKKEWFI